MDESGAANRSQAGLATVPPRAFIAERYRVLSVLGEGSSGIVYLCEHTALAKAVAVKVLHRELADNTALVARFTREAQTAARLDHPSSVHVLDFGQDRDGMLYLVMEFVDGPDLSQLLDDKIALDDERIVHIMGCILSALSAAHALGIVHRDLKPENVLVRLAEPGSGEADVVKVCDFGVAQLSPVRIARSGSFPIGTQSRRVTGEGMMVGTPWYMSPEQARAEALDARSDIYSAGVVLFQLLTRTLPFLGDDVMAVAIMHCTTPPPPPSGYGAVHPGLEAVCLKALSKTPEARYQSASEMLTALREAIATQPGRRSLARVSRTSLTALVPVAARPELPSTTPMASPSVRPPPPSRKLRPSLLVAGVATTLLGVAAVPRLLPSRHALVDTLSAAASRSASVLEQTFGSRGAPQPRAAEAPIHDDPEMAEALPLAAAESLPPATAELGLPTGASILETPLATPARAPAPRPTAAVVTSRSPVSNSKLATAPLAAAATAPESTGSASVGEPTAGLSGPNAQLLTAAAPQGFGSRPVVSNAPVNAEERDAVPETASEAATSAAEIALATLPATPPPTAAAPAAKVAAEKIAEVRPKTTTPVTFARVDIAAEHLPPGTSRASLRSALNQAALLGCYTQARLRAPTAILTSTALELKTNTSGRIVAAHADNPALPQALRECLEQVARSGNVRTGEGGEVHVTVELLPSP
ncbi:MAG TPA: serine/threonine-protein kinase [Polyangiales bacterium]|nr:serine/threonine-protein kinase [Polyangiales bacterium]